METPETTRELREAAWAVANGMRVVDELVRRAGSVAGSYNYQLEQIAAGEESYEKAFGPASSHAYLMSLLEELAGTGTWDTDRPSEVIETEGDKVIPGGAGHWYALWEDGTLMGRPMEVGESGAPKHPSVNDDGWYEITDPAPDVDDAAIIAELTR